jgi:hypothetical protein
LDSSRTSLKSNRHSFEKVPLISTTGLNNYQNNLELECYWKIEQENQGHYLTSFRLLTLNQQDKTIQRYALYITLEVQAIVF